jgi:hypothetical protein
MADDDASLDGLLGINDHRGDPEVIRSKSKSGVALHKMMVQAGLMDGKRRHRSTASGAIVGDFSIYFDGMAPWMDGWMDGWKK